MIIAMAMGHTMEPGSKSGLFHNMGAQIQDWCGLKQYSLCVCEKGIYGKGPTKIYDNKSSEIIRFYGVGFFLHLQI